MNALAKICKRTVLTRMEEESNKKNKVAGPPINDASPNAALKQNNADINSISRIFILGRPKLKYSHIGRTTRKAYLNEISKGFVAVENQ